MRLIWFKNDLRLGDNPALHAANADSDGPLLLLYVLDERAGAASRWWLHYSLTALSSDIAVRGGQLILRRGDPVEIIARLVRDYKVTDVHTARSYEPFWRETDRQLDATLKQLDCALHRHLSTSLFPPERITTKAGKLFGVYTPFSKSCFEAGVPSGLLPAPERLSSPAVAGEALDTWRLLPRKPDWAGGLRAEWTPGEAGAQARLTAFLAGPIEQYDQVRDFPSSSGTSRLAPHIHFGEISPRQVWQCAYATEKTKGVEVFLKELLWREFSLNQLWQHPALRTQPIRKEFNAFGWQNNETHLAAWQRGRTGIPIVDAGMRELWQTGWMHNRVRMICASYLVKHLLIPWQEGEKWFWDTLCEADEAANGASWQWVAGCGADAAPYFRIFNPVLQGQKFDPKGAYVRRFVPELSKLPDSYIHTPWDAPSALRLKLDYPAPIKLPADGRQAALDAYSKMQEAARR